MTSVLEMSSFIDIIKKHIFPELYYIVEFVALYRIPRVPCSPRLQYNFAVVPNACQKCMKYRH